MENVSSKLCMLGLASWLGLFVMARSPGAAQPAFPSMPGQRGMLGKRASTAESISSNFKQGMDKVTRMLQPDTPVEPPDDPVSLFSKATPRAETYVAVARLYEQTDRLQKAAEHYQKALDHTPNYLGGLLGLARVKSRMGNPDAALKLYHQAVKAHPKEASVYNNLGAFYGSRRRFDEAIDALQHAIRLRPKQTNYRANIAVVLVHQGRAEDAFMYLRAVQSEAVAYYNVGFLLKGEGQPQAAAQHFAAALRSDRSLTEAQYWLDRLKQAPVQARAPTDRPELGVRVSRRPARPAGPIQRRTASQEAQHPAKVRQLPPPPRSSRRGSGRIESGAGRSPAPVARSSPSGFSIPRRLPPTSNRPIIGPRPAPFPAGSYRRPATPTAPLPR